jgi:xylulokinase
MISVSETYVLASDLGTSSTKSSVIDMQGRVLGTAQQAYQVEYPHEGWAEQDPRVYWNAIKTTARRILKTTKIDPQKVAAFTLDAMMLSVIPVDVTGRPVRKTILWLDVRATDFVSDYMNRFPMGDLLAKGIIPVASAKDPLPKLLWIKKKEPHVFAKAARFVDVKDWILYQCGVGDFYTDWTCACLWNYFNLNTHLPEGELIEDGIGIPMDRLATLAKTTDILGTLSPTAARELGLTTNTQVVCGCGDVPAVAIGSGAIADGKPHLYIGSSGWIAQHQKEVQFDLSGTGTIASANPDRLLLTGQMESAGACLAWLVDNLCTSEQQTAKAQAKDVYELINQAAAQVPPGSRGLLYLPWPVGERCPFINPYVRGAFVNLSLDHTRAHLARSVMEGVAYNTRWVQDVFATMGHPVKGLNACGGGAKSNLWLQIYADTLKVPIRRVTTLQDAGSVGVALVAAIALGTFKSFRDLERLFTIDREFHPTPANSATYDRLYKSFRDLFDTYSGVCYQLNASEP